MTPAALGFGVALISAAWVTACDKPVHREPAHVGDILWRVPAVIDGHLWLGIPAASGNRVFLAVESSIAAYDSRNGHELWNTRIHDNINPLAKNLVYSSGLVMASEEDGITAFDAVTGAIRWHVLPDDSIIQAYGAADARTYYTGSRAHLVHALSLANGATLWTANIAGPGWVRANVIGLAVSGDTLFVTGALRRKPVIIPRDIFVIALDCHSGSELWRYETHGDTADHALYSAPVVTARSVIQTDERERAIFALDRQTGVKQWVVHTDSSWGGPAPIVNVADGTVYVGSSDQFVYAIDVETGALRWKTKIGASVNHVVACGRYVFANAQNATILDRATGAVVGYAADGDEDFVTSHFIALGDRVVATGTEAIYAIAC